MAKLRILLIVALACAVVFVAWTLLRREGRMERNAMRRTGGYQDFEGLDSLKSVTILRFYASNGVLTEGESASICYGVYKAKAVRIDPPVEALSPSRNRCLSVAPKDDTRYTLTAEGEDGRTVSESFLIQVTADPYRLPRINYFVNQEKTREAGRAIHSLCFSAENAEEVSVDPPVIPTLKGAPRGCFYVSPEQTTTYTLNVSGRHGTSEKRKLTIQPQ